MPGRACSRGGDRGCGDRPAARYLPAAGDCRLHEWVDVRMHGVEVPAAAERDRTGLSGRRVPGSTMRWSRRWRGEAGLMGASAAPHRALRTRSAIRLPVGLGGKDAVLTIHDMQSLLECIQFVRRTAVQTARAPSTVPAMISGCPRRQSGDQDDCSPAPPISKSFLLQAHSDARPGSDRAPANLNRLVSEMRRWAAPRPCGHQFVRRSRRVREVGRSPRATSGESCGTEKTSDRHCLIRPKHAQPAGIPP